MNFTKAIVKKPAKSIVDGISTSNLGKPNFKKALKQHENYVEALKKAGLEVTVLESDNKYPDSTFVEDPAIVTKDFAVITNPGAESRKGETKEIAKILSNFYSEDQIFKVQEPATLEGGDVMKVNNIFYIGLSGRTNKKGGEELREILEENGLKGIIVDFEDILHLKTGIAYIGDNTLVTIKNFIDKNEFSSYDKIILDDEESYAANCIRVNDYVIIPKGFPKAKNKIERAGFKTLSVDVSEFRKIDGGLSCLSLRF